MNPSIVITAAPCCWGVDDPENPHLPSWEKVLDEALEAGFGGIEAGPYGYLPHDVPRIAHALEERGLAIVAGTIFDDLVSSSNREKLLRQTRDICDMITHLPTPEMQEGQRYPAPYLTVMDWGHDARDYAAGHSRRAKRLDAAAWAGMVENIRMIATAARDSYGVRVTIHPHAGGYIEFADELEKIAKDLPPELVGLCLDTGHMAYSGMDPVATLKQYWDRVDYIHFKDINPVMYAQIMQEHIRFFDACAKGVMCPIGQGSIDYPSIHALLVARGYGGYITVEQERDPRNSEGALVDLAASRAFLEKIGFISLNMDRFQS